MAGINENCITHSYTMQHGYIKYCKGLFEEPKCRNFVEDTFYIANKNLDDEPLQLTLEEMKLLLKLLEPIQAVANLKQNSIDSTPRPTVDIDGPWPSEVYSQKILFLLHGEDCGFVRAITWIAGRQVKLTLETHRFSRWNYTKLYSHEGVITIDLSENLEMIKKFVDGVVRE
jgi:hypothetical protein